LSRGQENAKNAENLHIVKGDICVVSSYSDYLEGMDVVLHMAAVTHTNDSQLYYRVNTHATADLVKVCKKKGNKRFVYISTRAISEKGGDYSNSKLLAERVVKESGLDWTIMRLSEVYGLGGKEGVEMVLDQVQNLPFVPVIGDGSFKISPVHVNDVVLAIASVLEKDAASYRKIYNIAGPQEFTYNQFVDEILAFKGLKKAKIHIPMWLCSVVLALGSFLLKDRFMAKDQLTRLRAEKDANIKLAGSELNYHPHSVKEMLFSGKG
jgi:nucleoside-diphosphate-sugar epimerase